jgi:hypothetical protein
MLNIRRAVLDDADGIAQVHVALWRETYPGLVPEDFLKYLSIERRKARWAESLSNPADEYHRAFVADVDQKIAGFANFGGERDNDPNYRGELFAIYFCNPAMVRELAGIWFMQLRRIFLRGKFNPSLFGC